MEYWLFHLDSAVSAKSLLSVAVPWHKDQSNNNAPVSSSSLCEMQLMVCVGDRKQGGLRLMNSKLSEDVALAPVPPPHVHVDFIAPSFSTTSAPRPQSINVVTSMVRCRDDHEGGDVWFGWSSGHITVLNFSHLLSDGVSGNGKSAACRLPRYADWEDLLYAHRGAVHQLASIYDGRAIVSCSYDLNVIVWEARSRRQLRSLSGLMRSGFSSSPVTSSSTGGIGGVCRVVCEIPVWDVSVPADSSSLRHVALLVTCDRGTKCLIGDLESLFGFHDPTSAEGRTEQQSSSASLPCCHLSGFNTAPTGNASYSSLEGHSLSITACDVVSVATERTTLVCLGDDSGAVHFIPCFTNGEGSHNASSWLRDLAACFVDPQAWVLTPPSKAGKVVLIKACATMCHDEDVDSSGITTCSFLVTWANRLGMVHCRIFKNKGSNSVTIVDCYVTSLVTTASTIMMLRPLLAGVDSRPPSVSPSDGSMFLSLAADGSLAAVYTFYPVTKRPAHRIATAPQTIGDNERQQIRLRHALELVHKAKSSVMLADTALEDSLVQQGALMDANQRLKDQLQDAESALSTLRQGSLKDRRQLDQAESDHMDLRQQCQRLDDEVNSLRRQLDMAAAEVGAFSEQTQTMQEAAHMQSIKLEEALLQIRRAMEDKQFAEDQWRVSDNSCRELRSENELLASKVVELERLLANSERSIAHHVKQATTNGSLLNDLHALVGELKVQLNQTAAERNTFRDEAARCREDLLLTQKKLAAARAALDHISGGDAGGTNYTHATGTGGAPVSLTQQSNRQAMHAREEYFKSFAPPVRGGDAAASRYSANGGYSSGDAAAPYDLRQLPDDDATEESPPQKQVVGPSAFVSSVIASASPSAAPANIDRNNTHHMPQFRPPTTPSSPQSMGVRSIAVSLKEER